MKSTREPVLHTAAGLDVRGGLAKLAGLAGLVFSGLTLLSAPALGQQDPFTVMPDLSGQAVFSAAQLTVNGSSTVDSKGVNGSPGANDQGHVVSNADITLNGNARVKGNATCGPGKTIRTNGSSSVTGVRGQLPAPRDPAPIDLSGLAVQLAARNDNGLIGPTSKNHDPLQGPNGTDLVLNGNEALTLPAGTFYFTKITVNGGSRLDLSGLTRVLCTGPVTVNGQSTVNEGGGPWQLRLWVSGFQVDLNGGGGVSGFVYAPSAQATVDGGAVLTGGLFASRVTLNGGGRVTRSADDSAPLALSLTSGGQPLGDGSVFRTDVAPVVTATGGIPPVATRVTLDGAAFVAGTPVTAEGTHRLVATADDLAGRHVEATVTFVIDRTAPRLTVQRPASGEVVAVSPIDVYGTSDDAVGVTVNGVPAVPTGGAYVARGVALAEGSNTLSVTGADRAGNVGSTLSEVVLDTQAPTLLVTSPASGAITKEPAIPVQGTVADAHLASLSVGGVAVPVPPTGGSFSVAIPLAEGPNAISVEARDVVGHVASRSAAVERDSVKPVIRVEEGGVSLQDGRAYDHDLVIALRVVDAHPDSLTATLDGAAFASGTTVSSEGDHVLSAAARDLAGNSESVTLRFTIDKTPPSLAITSPAPGTTVTSLPQPLEGTSGDAVAVLVNGFAVTPSAGRFTIAAFPFAEGPVTVTATGTDAAGNTGTAAATYLVDTLPPQVALSSPPDGAILGSVPLFVSGAASDANLTGVSVNGLVASLGPDGRFRAGPFSPADGPVTFTATATDRASRTASTSRTVTIDTVPPVIAIRDAATTTPVMEGALFNAPVALAVGVTDATTQAQTTQTTTLDGAPYAGGAVSAEGSHRVEVVARDGAGNTATASVTFVLDTVEPVFSSLLPPAGTIGRTTPVTVSGQVSADTVTVTVGGQAAACSGGAFSLAGVALAEGPNDLLLVATDRAGNQGTATLRLVLDTTSPVVALSAPADGQLVGSLGVTVSGTATDANLDAVSVEGAPATVQPGGSFTRAGVALAEGPNVLTATARDKAGNSASASVHVVADSLPPTLSITAPGAGTVLGESPVTVAGTASDPHLDIVLVNGVAAAVDASGRFTAAVPVTEGANTLTAVARDTLAHQSQSSVSVTLDSAAPSVLVTSPQDGSRFRTTPQTVRGTVDSSENLEGVTVNGVAATLAGTSFEASVPLLEGTNTLTTRARKTTGKEGTARIDVVLDTRAPALTTSSPAEGQSGVSLTPEIRLTFSEALDPSTVVDSSFTLAVPGEAAPALAASLGGAGSNVVVLLPATPLLDGRPYTLAASGTLKDLAGNEVAAPIAIHFTTVDQTPPPAPVVDEVPPVLCASSLTLTGTAEPGATVSVTGGTAGAQATVGADGRFTVAVPVSAGSTLTLLVTARDVSGNLSAPATVGITVDCAPPHVVDVAAGPSSVAVTFDEPLLPSSVVAGATARLDETGGNPISAAAELSAGDRTLTLTASGVDLAAIEFTLSLSSGVTDLAGNALTPFVRTFAPQTVSTVLLGEVYDDAIGRPLGGATATILVSGGSATAEPHPFATATSAGTFAVPVLTGDALVRIDAPGYLPVYRRESIAAGGSGSPGPSSATLFDARLTPEAGPATATSTPAGATYSATFGSRVVTLEVPAGSLPAGVVARLTLRRPQGLPVLAPLGWSVASAVRVSLGDASGNPLAPSGTMMLSLPDLYGATSSTPLVLARLDAASLQWVDEGTASLATGNDGVAVLTASIASAGDWAVLVPDPAPTAPDLPAPGMPLAGVALPAEDPLESATVTASPVDVLPSQTADVSLTVATPRPVPSGFPVQTLVSEDLTLLDGSHLAAPSFLSDLVLLRRGDGSLGLTIPVRASEGARRVALSVGFERFTVKKFPFEVRRGVVVGSSGGTVTGPSGWSATLPSGAVPGATALALTPLGVDELPAGIPAGFDLVAAVRLTTGGVSFALPATLAFAVAAPPPAGRDLLVVSYEERAGFLVVRPLARAAWDEASQTIRSLPIARAAFPWPGVLGEGTYAVVSARDPIAYVAGRVLDVDASPLGDTLVSAGDGWTLQAVSESDGTFALAIRALPSSLAAVSATSGNSGLLTVTPSAPSQEITGIELRLSVTAPYVTGVTPSPGSTVLVGSRFTVTFSEPVDPLSLTSETFFLVATVQGQPVVVPARTLADPSGLTATLVPAGALPDNTPLVLGVSRAVRDRNGYGLVDAISKQAADYTASYTTEDLTPPDAKPYLVRVGLPTGDPSPAVTITGAPGAVCGGCHVTAFNDTTLATASADALSDGSFSLTLLARASDTIRIEIEKPNGTKQTLAPVPFTDDGGKTALVGTRGGTWETPDGIRIAVPQAAFAGPVTVVTARIPRAAFEAEVAPPRDLAFVDSFRMDFPVRASTGFDLSFAAPATIATDQFVLAEVVEVFGQKRLMVVDLLTLRNGRLVTDRTSQLQNLRQQGYVVLVDPASTAVGGVVRVDARALSRTALGGPGTSVDDPKSFFDGVFEKGTYALYNAAVQMATVAGTLGAGNTVATSSSSDFVFDSTHALNRTYFRLFCPVGTPFDLTLVDPDSGLTLFQGSYGGPSSSTTAFVVNPPNPDQVRPGVLQAGPAPLFRFDAPPAGAVPLAVTPGVSATSVGSGATVTVTVTVAAGTVPVGALLRLVDFNRPGVSPATPAGAGPSTVQLAGVVPGDPLAFTIENVSASAGNGLTIRFDEEMKAQGSNWKSLVLVENRSACPPVGYDVVEEPSSAGGVRELLVVQGPSGAPGVPPGTRVGWLRSGCPYSLRIKHGATDVAGNEMANDFAADFSLPPDDPISSQTTPVFLRKILYHGGLLLTTGEDQSIRVYDARLPGTIGAQCDMQPSDPAHPGQCPAADPQRTLAAPLPGVGRDLAVDRFGRLVCVGGGTPDSQGSSPGLGFLRLYDFVPTCGSPTYDCGRRLAPRGTTIISAAVGDATLTYPPQGTPRKISLLEGVQERSWTVDSGDTTPATPPATGTTVTVSLPLPTCPSAPPVPTEPPVLAIQKSTVGGRQGYRRSYTITSSSAFPPSPRCHRMRFISFTNLATGETVNARTDANGTGLYPISGVGTGVTLTASTGDRIRMWVSGVSVAVVDVLGYGLAFVDLDAVYDPDDIAGQPPSVNDPTLASKLLAAYDGSSRNSPPPGQSLCTDASTTGAPKTCDEPFQRCGPLQTCDLRALFNNVAPPGMPAQYEYVVNDLLALTGVAVEPTPDADGRFWAFGSLNGFGLVSFSIDLASPPSADGSPRRPGRERTFTIGTGQTATIRDEHLVGLVNGLPLKPSGLSTPVSARATDVAFAGSVPPPEQPQWCRGIWGEAQGPKDLAFVAAGNNGVYVVDVTNPALPTELGRFESAGGALTVSVDASRKLLYVSDAGEGLKVFSFDDPCGATPGTRTDVDDPRLLATYPPLPGNLGNTPVSVDPDTGIVYSSATGSGTSVVSGFDLVAPPLYAVADTDGDGRLELVDRVVPLGVPNPEKDQAIQSVTTPTPGHDPYVPEAFQVLAFLPGGNPTAGKTVEVEVSATTIAGGPHHESAPGFPKSRLSSVPLTRQSDDPSDPAYNRYQSAPIVVVADPRAQLAYPRTPADDDPAGPGACRNCAAAADLAPRLLTESGAEPRLELLAGELIEIRFSDGLKTARPHLAGLDLDRTALFLSSVPADLVPSPMQSPVVSGSSVLGVDTRSGEFSASGIDLSVAGRVLDFALDRTYRSQVLHDGPFGRNMDSSLFERLRVLPNGEVEYYDGSGRRFTFQQTSAEPPVYESPAGIPSVLSRTADEDYVLRHPDKSTTRFDQTGRIRSFRDRHVTAASTTDGNRQRFQYDGEGRLAAVVDDTGRRYELSWDASTGRLASVRDFDNRTVEYGYSRGRLDDVRGPDPGSSASARSTTHFAYGTGNGDLRSRLFGDGQLEQVVDGTGKVPYTVHYPSGKLGVVDFVQTEDGVTSFTVPAAGHASTEPTFVADPLGYVSSYVHTASGHLASVTDEAGFTTSFTYQGGRTSAGALRDDGLPQTVLLPEGQLATYTYDVTDGDRTRQFNLVGTKLEARSGKPAPPLLTSITYDSHNLPRIVTSPDQTVTTIERNAQGDATSLAEPDTAPVTLVPDAFGRLVTFSDTSGRTETRDYFDDPGGSGQLHTFTVSGGETAPTVVTYTRDARGNVRSTRDGRDRTVTYDVNVLDQVEKVTSGGTSPGVSNYRYDANGQVLGRSQVLASPPGQLPITTDSSYEYDSLGRLTSLTSTDAGTVTFHYDGQGNLSSVTDPEGTTGFVYDPRGLLSEIHPPAGGATIFRYDGNGTLVSVTNPLGGTTTYTLDGLGRLTGRLDPANLVESIERDVMGRPLSRRQYALGPDGNPGDLYRWTEYRYDNAGRLLEEIRKLFADPLPRPWTGATTDVVTETVYDALGRVRDVIDPLGRTRHTDYDAQGRVKGVTDPAGNQVLTEYDPSGKRSRTTVREPDPAAPSGHDDYVTEYEYDDQGRLVKLVEKGKSGSELVRERRYEYDQAGRKTREIDPDLGETTFEYDGAGRKTVMTDPVGAVTRWDYDLLGNLVRLTDARGNPTTYAYDAAGRLLFETRGDPVQTGPSPALPTWKSTYDAMGNRLSLTDPDGTVVTYHYDLSGRPTGRTIERGAGVDGPTAETVTLDVLGRVTSWTSAGSGVDLQGTARYDSLDRMTRETVRAADGPVRTIAHEYDLAGNRTALTYPSERRFTFQPDPLNRLQEVRDPSGVPVVRYGYLGSRQTTKTYGNNLVEERAYDSAPWLKSIRVGLPAPPPPAPPTSPLASVEYATRNLRGHKLEIVRGSRKDAYAYDAAGRVTRESLGLPEPPPPPPQVAVPEVETAYTLDPLLNVLRRQRTAAGATETVEPGSGGTAIDTRNRYTEWGIGPSFQSLSYDPNGNLKQYGATTLSYDADNRLSLATTAEGSYRAFHDPWGQRVREQRSVAGSSVELDVVESGHRVLEVFPKDGTTPIQTYVYGRGIDEVVLAELDPAATGTATPVYPLQDELGNVTHLTDASGNVLERYTYEGYGKFRIFGPGDLPLGASAYGWTRLFQGREYNGLIDGYDFRARTLFPELGRFAQEDPAGTVDSANRYQALLGNWTGNTDPWGLEASVSQSGWFVVADPATGKIQKVAPGWARSNPAALKDVLLKEGGLSEAEAIALMTIGGVSQAPTYAPCAPGQDCIGPGQGVRSPGADVALQVAAQPVCSANGLSNAVDSVMGQGGPIPCPIGPPRTEAGEAANQAMAMYGAVAIAGGRGSGGVAAGAPDVSFVVDEAGMTVRAEGVVTGPHRGRGKGSRPDPPGGLTPGEHRGHLIPEGGVDNPSLVNVPQNIISETPRSNLGPKKSFDNLASRIAAQNPRASVRVVAEPLRRAGEARPYAVTYWVERDGVRVHGVTIFNK